MKGKLLGFGVALLAMATIGVVQLQSLAAEPGQVGNTPRCTVDVKGQAGSAFDVQGSKATVDFTVRGSDDCKVQLSVNSFYAPSMDGMPYDQQTLFDRKTKEFTKGEYSMTGNLPTDSNENKGCFYQVDLTYGTNNVTPVLAYGHGKIEGCGQPNPVVTCKDLTVTPLSGTSFRFDATAEKTNADIKAYVFEVTNATGAVVARERIESTTKNATYTYNQTTPGEYSVKVTVKSNLDDQTSPACSKRFTVPQPPVTPPSAPGVDIVKYIGENSKYQRVGVNVEFSYRIDVRNTGDVDLDNVLVTDTPDRAITLVSVSPPSGKIENNTFTYTIPKLVKGETRSFRLMAKVPAYLAGTLTNTVCVDAPAIPGNPDKCDSATVDVPPSPEQPPVTPPVVETPVELPQTGTTDVVMQMVGAMSLVGAGAYYIASRRSI